MRRVAGQFLEGGGDDLVDPVQQDRRRPPRTRLAGEPVQPLAGEPAASPGDHVLADPELGGHGLVVLTIGAGHNPRGQWNPAHPARQPGSQPRPDAENSKRPPSQLDSSRSQNIEANTYGRAGLPLDRRECQELERSLLRKSGLRFSRNALPPSFDSSV